MATYTVPTQTNAVQCIRIKVSLLRKARNKVIHVCRVTSLTNLVIIIIIITTTTTLLILV